MCQTINLEGGGTAFICSCGKNKDHECNEEGSVLLLADGDRVEDTEENQEKFREQIRGGSVCCTICGRASIDDAPYF